MITLRTRHGVVTVMGVRPGDVQHEKKPEPPELEPDIVWLREVDEDGEQMYAIRRSALEEE